MQFPTPVLFSRLLFACVVASAIGHMAAPSWAASPGLPFTEDFADSSLKDSSQTNANWSTEEQAVYLQWRNHMRAGQANWPSTGPAVGSSDTDSTYAIALGDVDGDGDLDVVAGNDGQNNMLYLNDGDAAPFDSIVNGTAVGSSDTDRTFSIALGDIDGDGDLDVVAGGVGQNKLYLNDGSAAPFDSIVNGTAVGSSDADDTQSIALGDVDGDGDLDVVAGNHEAEGQANKVYLNDGSAAPFDSITNGTAVGSSDTDRTSAIALGDVDGDGDLDVIAGNFLETNKVYLNDGSAAPFDSIVNGTAVGSSDTDNTMSIALGDVDGDGDLDVVAGNHTRANKVYLNDGSAAPFDSIANGTAVGSSDLDYTFSITLGDVDGDGDLDVVAGNYNNQANKLYLNDGDAAPFDTLASGAAVGSSDTDNTYSVALGDVDGDGDVDVVAGNNGQNKLYLNDGDSAPFDSVTSGTSVGSSDTDDTKSIALGDVDGDGDLDVVAGNLNQTNKVYLNDGDAAPFDSIANGASVGSSDTDGTWFIALGDVDGDGSLDVVAGNDGQTNKLYLNDGDSAPFDSITNGTAVGSSDTNSTYAIALGDVDGDGDLDVVAGNLNQTNKVYLNDGDAAPFDSITNGTAVGSLDTDSTYAVALGDVDGDGDLDVVAGNNGQNKLYLNDGDSAPFDSITNGTSVGSSDTDGTVAIALGDVDGDGDLDVVAGNWNSQVNKLYLNDGDAAPFDSITNGTVVGGSDTDNTQSIALGDVDGDGDLDLLVGNYNQVNWLYLNDGGAAPFHTLPSGTSVGSSDTDVTYAIAVGDVDGDGDLDVVAGNWNSQTNKLYLNDGDSAPFDSITNGTAVGSSDTDSTYSIALGDVDGDGDLDVVAGNDGQTNKLYLNDGVGDPFDSIANGTAVGSSDTDFTWSIALGDVDGDGDLDVVAGNSGENNKLYLNDGSAAPFASITNGTSVGSSDTDSTLTIALGDVDGDGDLDVVAGNYGVANKLYLNDGDAAPFDSITNGTSVGSSDTDYTVTIALGDVDGDGDLDVVAANDFQMNKLYLNDGDAAPFDSITNGTAVGSSDTDITVSIALDDIDGDGDLDVVAGNAGQNNKLYLNRAYDVGLGVVSSLKVNDTETDIARVTLTATDVANTAATRNTDLRYYVSNDGGTTWYRADSGTAFDFTAFGSDLRWKAELASLSPAISPKLDTIVLEENLLSYNGTTATTLRDTFASLDANGDGFLSLAEAGFTYLAELKAYDEDGDGQLSLSDLLELTVGPVGVTTPVYVDFDHPGTESGTFAEPFDSLLEAATFVANGGTVSITTGTSSETILIDKDVDLIATGGTVIIGTP